MNPPQSLHALRLVGCCVLTACIALDPSLVSAQEQDPPPTVRRRKALQNMTDQELKEAGFQWEPEADHGPSVTAALIAVGPGAVIHGMGHFYARNQPTAVQLLIGEMSGVALLGLGAISIFFAETPDDLQAQFGNALVQTGGSLFALSYSLDIIGAAKGTREDLPPSSLSFQQGIRVSSAYTLLNTSDLSCKTCHFLDVSADFDFDWILLQPSLRQDLTGAHSEFGLTVDWRLVPGSNPTDFIALNLSLENTTTDPTTTLTSTDVFNDSAYRLEAGLKVNLTLGSYIAHLKHVGYTTVLAFGYVWGAGERAVVPGNEGDRGYPAFRSSLWFNLTPEWMLEPSYVYSQGDTMAPINNYVGSFAFRTLWSPLEELDVFATTQIGDGFALSSGVLYTF